MKIKEEKHNHKLTDLLKVFLFAIFLLLPFISVASKSLYVIFNKNAKDSYYGETINEEIDTYVSVEDLENGNTYLFENYTITIPQTQSVNQFTYIYVLNVEDLKGNLLNPQNINYFVFYYSSNNYPINRVYYKDTTSRDYNLTSDFLNFSFKIKTTINLDVNPFLTDNNFFYTREYNKYSYLDNAFEYSINQLQNSTWFNWVENTTTYTTIKAMTDQLQIQLLVIPMLLTYWFLLIVIYLIIDIVMKVITTLTHMIGMKS